MRVFYNTSRHFVKGVEQAITVSPNIDGGRDCEVGVITLRGRFINLIRRAEEGARLSKKQGGNKVMCGPMFIGPEFYRDFDSFEWS